MSSQTITLFSRQADPGPRPVSVAASMLCHGLAVALVWFSFLYKPPSARVTMEHFPVRELDLVAPDMQKLAAARHIAYPARAAASQGRPSPSRPPLAEVAQAKPGPQTLIQPDLLKTVTLPEQIPLPQVVIWKPSPVPVPKVVLPPPQKPTAADVKPSVERPNEEMTLADVNIASSFRPTPRPLVTATTTTAVAVHIPQQVSAPPVTSSYSQAQPTPAAIVSLSNLRMEEGKVTLPPVNTSLVKVAPGALASGDTKNASTTGKDNSADKPGPGGQSQSAAGNPNNHAPGANQGVADAANNHGAGAGQSPTAQGNSPNGAAAGKPQAPDTASANAAGAVDDEGNQPLSTVITAPKDGHFNSVVVGASLEDQFPEIAGVWNGRLAYTVYLHVGLARSWVLQYSLPRSADAASAGTVARLDAPWPYNIVRPNLEPGAFDADALMVHGFVNQSGHFETLTIVFPESFPQAQFVLAALQKWQFRPALQDGQSAKVEVLLIIPEQLE